VDTTDLEEYTSSIHKVDISRVKEESGSTGRFMNHGYSRPLRSQEETKVV
jgi:hypothetical protein